MEPHRPISVFMHDAEGMPNERTFGMGKMRLRVGILVYNPTLGSNSYDRVVYSPTVRKCKSSCNWDGERLEIWCRNSCFLQNGWELLVILFHESEYVDNSVVGTVQIPLADLTNCAPERNDRIQYQMSGGGGKLTCTVKVGDPQSVQSPSPEEVKSSKSSTLDKFLFGVLVNVTSSLLTNQ